MQALLPLTLLILSVAGSSAGHAQNAGMEATLVGGVVIGLPMAFEEHFTCRTEPVDGPGIWARLGRSVASGVQVVVGVGAQGAFLAPSCVFDLAIPPSNGEFVVVRPGEHAAGFTMLPLSAQLEFTPFRLGQLESRLMGGVEWVPSKRMWNPIVGAALVAGRGATRFRFEVDRVWYAIPQVTTVTTYQNSVVVASETTHSRVHARAHRMRLGISFHPF